MNDRNLITYCLRLWKRFDSLAWKKEPECENTYPLKVNKVYNESEVDLDDEVQVLTVYNKIEW